MRHLFQYIVLLILLCSCSSEVEFASLPEVDDSAIDYTASPQYGKSVGVFGGSFCAIEESDSCKAHWHKRLGLVITDYGINGAAYSNAIQDNGVQTAVQWACHPTIPAYDIYLLWSPSNDFSKGDIPIGSLEDFTEADQYDSTKLSTMLGGLNHCYQMIQQKNRDAQILLFTTLPIFNKGKAGYDTLYTEGKSLRQYVDAQIRWARQHDIPCLDLFRRSGFTHENYGNYYQSDALHPNVRGYRHLRVMTTRFLAFPNDIPQ